jgi:hypothetical protein
VLVCSCAVLYGPLLAGARHEHALVSTLTFAFAAPPYISLNGYLLYPPGALPMGSFAVLALMVPLSLSLSLVIWCSRSSSGALDRRYRQNDVRDEAGPTVWAGLCSVGRR